MKQKIIVDIVRYVLLIRCLAIYIYRKIAYNLFIVHRNMSSKSKFFFQIDLLVLFETRLWKFDTPDSWPPLPAFRSKSISAKWKKISIFIDVTIKRFGVSFYLAPMYQRAIVLRPVFAFYTILFHRYYRTISSYEYLARSSRITFAFNRIGTDFRLGTKIEKLIIEPDILEKLIIPSR